MVKPERRPRQGLVGSAQPQSAEGEPSFKSAVSALDRILRWANAWHVEHRPYAYFARILRDMRAVQPADLDLDLSRVTKTDLDDLLALDVIVQGKNWDDRRPMLIGVDVRNRIRKEDVTTTVRRVNVLSRLGHDAFPAVCGETITPPAERAAASEGVLLRFFCYDDC